MTRTVLRPALLATVLAAAFPGAAAATKVTHTTQTAFRGDVSATFTFTTTTDNHGFNTYSKEHLTITRAGVQAYDAAVSVPQNCYPGCQPVTAPGSSVHVLDLEHNGEPDVVLDLYTGGAHCCSLEVIYWHSGSTYKHVVHNFADPGDTIKDLGHNGQLEFVSADDRFAYLFTSFAASGLPIQIFTFAQGKFTDVTRTYPKQVKRDAASWWKYFTQNTADGEGLIGAWAADEELLSNDALVRSTLNKQAQQGHLKGPNESGMKFVNDLLHKLKQFGYTH